jgi:phosphoenolpyruvate carboxykinase (GTP)
LHEADDVEQFFATFGDRMPSELTRQLDLLRTRLQAELG